MPHGEENYITVCNERWEVTDLPVIDEGIEVNKDDMQHVSALILRPCNCHFNDMPVMLQEQILN